MTAIYFHTIIWKREKVNLSETENKSDKIFVKNSVKRCEIFVTAIALGGLDVNVYIYTASPL